MKQLITVKNVVVTRKVARFISDIKIKYINGIVARLPAVPGAFGENPEPKKERKITAARSLILIF